MKFLNIIKSILKGIYYYSGFQHITSKLIINEDNKKYPTFFLWLIASYVALYGIADQRHSKELSRLDLKSTILITQTTSDISRKAALNGIIRTQRTLLPIRPEIYRPISVFYSFIYKKPDKQQIEESKRIIESFKKDLKEVDFSEANLGKANLKRANLQGADLTRSNLVKANLSGAILSKANLKHCNLDQVLLSRSNLVNTIFLNAILTNAYINKANLEGAVFRNADLTKSNFEKSNLSNVNFVYANLKKVNFREADLNGASFRGANLQEADFTNAKNIKKADFTGSNRLNTIGLNL